MYRATSNPTGFAFSDFELFLMGLIPAADVEWPLRYLVNAIETAASYTPILTRDFLADGIAEFSLAGFEARVGQRIYVEQTETFGSWREVRYLIAQSESFEIELAPMSLAAAFYRLRSP